MKKIYRNLLLASSAIASITLPMVSSSCNHKNKTEQNEIIKSIEAYRNVCQLYVNQANKYFTQVIIDTKNDNFLAPIADKFYGELSLSSPNGKLDNLFYNYYNDIKNVNNFANQMQQTFQAILTKVTNVDMEKPIDFYRSVLENHKSIGDMYNNFIQTYSAILGQAEKVNPTKAKEYQDKFVKDLDGAKKVFEFSIVPVVLLQLEIKNYGMHDMLSNLNKASKNSDEELRNLIKSSDEWINKWLNYVNGYKLQNIISNNLNISDVITELHNDFENNVAKLFYTKFMIKVLQQRQPEKVLDDQFNANPVYIKFSNSTHDSNKITTVNEILKQETITKNEKASQAIKNLEQNYSNHGKTLNPSYDINNFTNGLYTNIKLAYLANSQKEEAGGFAATLYNRDSTTKKFSSQSDTPRGLAQKFDKSSVNHVIKFNIPVNVAAAMGLILSPMQNSQEVQNFFKETNGYLPFGIRGLNSVNNYLIGQNLLVFNSLYAGLEGNRSVINQWDQLIFENYNFVLVNKDTALNVEAYIGINDDLYNKFFKIPGLVKTRKELENKQIVLEDKYLPWVKNFLIPKYQPSDGMNSTNYYNSKLAQIITIKDGNNYITVDKWMQALNNILDYLDAAPSEDQSQKTIQDAIKKLEAEKDSITNDKDYNDQIKQINEEKTKQEAIIASTDSSNEAKENAKKVLEQLKSALNTAKNRYDKNIKALDSQIADAKVTIQEWINTAKEHGLSINQYSDIALVKSQVTSILNKIKAPIDKVQSQIQSENDKLEDTGLLTILFKLQNNN
ncbi:hypothetical protein ACNQ1M_00100 [Mycoplasma sp. VS424B]|uniref:hypothetical protein n=1 Tax=Mycoplasma sp. VS424B TaxID=3401660 RepID=UPI003AAD0D42